MKQKSILIILIFFLLSGCFRPGGNRRRNTYSDSVSDGFPRGEDSGCQGDLRKCPIPVLDQSATTTEPNYCTADGSAGNNEAATQTYYRTTITGHGAQHDSNKRRGYLWSSHKATCVASCVTANPSDGTDRQTCLRTNNCVRVGWGNLSSDTRFKVRIRSFSHPARYTFDSMGTQCSKLEKRYGTLRVTVGLKHPTSTDYTSTTTLQADVGGCSNVANLSMPSNDGDQELRIIAVEWDYTCAYYKAVYNGRSTGGSDPNQQNNCPLATFGAGGFKSSCWQIELQWSLDHTYDIPTGS